MALVKKSQMAFNLSRGFIYVALIIYSAYVIGVAIQNNFATNQQIKSLREDIVALKDDVNNLQNTIIYYQTDSFKELEARKRLGLKGAGETIIMLPKNNEKKVDSSLQTPQEKTDQEEENTSNPVKWYRYIFEKQ